MTDTRAAGEGRSSQPDRQPIVAKIDGTLGRPA